MAKRQAARKRTSGKKTSTAKRLARGSFCVYAPSKKLVNCFKSEESAQNVVRGMNKGWKKICAKRKVSPGEGYSMRRKGR